MIGETPFPISIAQLDCDTLSAAVGAPVEAFESERIGEDRGMLGEIFVVSLTYTADATGPAAVICKFAALRDEALASSLRGRTNERELRCYDELLASSEVITPRFYGAWYDPDTAHFLLVQEAIDADTSVDQVAGIEPRLAALVATQAATLHHSRWEDPTLADLEWLPRLDTAMRLTNLTTLAANGWGPLSDLLGDELTDAERGLGVEFPHRLEQALRSLAAMPSTLIHSDLRADNLLFAPGGETVSLIDWQGAGVGPGSFDIAYLIAHSLSVDDRRSHEAGLIDRYLNDLAQAGTTQSHDNFMAGYAVAHHYGLAVACALPLIGDARQPRVKQLAGVMARRSIEALRDHGQLW